MSMKNIDLDLSISSANDTPKSKKRSKIMFPAQTILLTGPELEILQRRFDPTQRRHNGEGISTRENGFPHFCYLEVEYDPNLPQGDTFPTRTLYNDTNATLEKDFPP
jgi:hypothetical protein